MSANQEQSLIASVAILSGLFTLFYISPVNSVQASTVRHQMPVMEYKTASSVVIAETVVKPLEAQIGYWDIVAEIESKSGKLLIQRKDKRKGVKNCNNISNYCGFYQLGKKALQDINEWNSTGRKNRMVYAESLRQAKAYKTVTDGYGCSHLEGYKSYLIHQQGCSGIKKIIASAVDKKRHPLPKKILRNMANNSPYSYSSLNKSGGAVKFLNHWDSKWNTVKASL